MDEDLIDYTPSLDDSSRFSLECQNKINLTRKLIQEFVQSVDENAGLTSSVEKLTFKHGRSWSGYTHKGDGEKEHWENKTQLSSVSESVSKDDCLEGNFGAIFELKESMRMQMLNNFETTIVETLLDATTERPSTEIRLNGDIRPALREMWENVSIGLDDKLRLNEMSLAMPPETYSRFIKKVEEIEKTDPSFKEEIRKIKTKKWLLALVEHFENILKFNLHEEKRRNIEHLLRQLRALTEPQLHEDRCHDNSNQLTTEQ